MLVGGGEILAPTCSMHRMKEPHIRYFSDRLVTSPPFVLYCRKKHKKEKKKKREEAEVENEATEYKPTKRKTSAELAFEKAKRQKVILVVK